MFTTEDSSDVWDFTDEDVLHNCNTLFKIELVANLHALKACKSCHHLLCCRAPSVHCPGLQAPASSIEQICFSKTMWNIISGISLIGCCSNILFNSCMLLKWRLPINELPATHCNWNKCLLRSGITSPTIITQVLQCWTHLSQSSLKGRLK